MIEFLFGCGFGIILLLFIGWLDERYLGKTYTIKNKFKFYLMASCWELLFFVFGLLVGKCLK